ncbi:carbohydrate-selective porin [Cylindrospermum stagnale PCC 7417]|uniref:Carbohydrate-selective porin n=1 Tax=Cylindrospermum stagnale PCC 7417 TaxID=56107 RepID=K9WSZ0_9NOST|nr:iron uptake porin [Cylindrospermum stagnale]AFZ22901.1 carbohydrate-selective porin [Cylindrospermum stagnale PCC 7417]
MKVKLSDRSDRKAWILAWLIVGAVNGVTQKAIAQEYKDTELLQAQESAGTDESINLNFPLNPISPEDQSSEPTDDPMAQVTSVSQLKDVQATDWAFQALQSLVERYGCIAGYPDSTYRGNRALTRYEFAAGVNACLDRVNELIATASSDLSSREDLATLQKLQTEFAPELATLRGRVDKLEARTAEIAANQFSPTTKLYGTVVVDVQGRTSNRGDVNPRDGVKDTDDIGTNANVISYTRLDLVSQFSPGTFLWTSITNVKGATSPRFTSVDAFNNFNGDVVLGNEYLAPEPLISDLFFNWQATDNLVLRVGAAGMDLVTNFRRLNRTLGPDLGALSRFGQRNPLLFTGFGRAGVALDWQFAKNASLQAVYSSNNPGNPGNESGLFDGNTTTGVQLQVAPTKSLDFSLYYVNNYGSNGCMFTFVGDDCLTGSKDPEGNLQTGQPLQTNAVGASVNWQITRGINLGGWGGYTNSQIPGLSGTVETTNYMVYLNFPDLFAKGNFGGIYVGQPPKIISSDLPVGNNVPGLINGNGGLAGGQPGTTTHIEAFYRFRLTDNIHITPGIIHIIDPGHTPDSDPVTIGILRSTFLF